MIKIEDNDSPITAACKIIHGTRPYDPTPMMRIVARAITGSDESANAQDMFDLNEIKEIADYLLVYYNSHIPAEEGKT